MAYRNHEGYLDPTAGQALSNIRRKERTARLRRRYKRTHVRRPPHPAPRMQTDETKGKEGLRNEISQ